ncbi:MAG: WXG100 family type VII secretion target [Micromonosporaceae bacterium]|nr:WXG100 family type VII secretion target [Micromonosporaceae bacterium]
MSTTEAQAAVMEQVAGRFESTNSSLQSMLSSLMSQLEPLQSRFVGAGGTSFTQVKLAWHEDMQKINRALSETAAAIRSSGQNYTSSDEAAQQRVAATNRGGVNLPL